MDRIVINDDPEEEYVPPKQTPLETGLGIDDFLVEHHIASDKRNASTIIRVVSILALIFLIVLIIAALSHATSAPVPLAPIKNLS